MKTKSQKFLDAFSIVCAIVLFIGFLALCVFAVKLSIETIDDTCYADSSVGVVKDNLFSNPNFNLQGDSLFSFNNYFAQDIVYTTGASLRLLNNGVLEASTTVSGVGHWIAFLFKASVAGTYTFTINADFVGSGGFLWRLRDTNYTTYVDSASENFSNYQYVTYNITDTSKNYILQLVMPARDISTNIYWVKYEMNSSFTGYVGNDYSNFGYQQGYDDGVKYTVDRLNLNNGAELLGSVSQVALKYGSEIFNSLQYNQNFSVYGRQGFSLFPPYDEFVYNNLTYSLYGPIPSGAPNLWPFMEYDRNTYEMVINVFSFSNINYVPILPFCYELVYIGQPIYITSDFILGTNYKVIIRSTDGTQTIFVNDFTPSGQFNGENFLDVSNYLVNGQTYNFYVYNSTGNISITTKNSYYTGLHSLCVFTINDAYTVGVNNYNQGYDDGYQNGYFYGRNLGYDAGHRDGVLENTDYSFTGLIGAVFDAPISAFSGLLNFNVLGVNLKSFVLAMLSLSVIIIILKIALGGST